MRLPSPLDLSNQRLYHLFMPTRCDTVPPMHTRLKKSTGDTWKAFDEGSATFLALSNGPAEVKDDHFTRYHSFL